MSTKKQQLFRILHNRTEAMTYNQIRNEFGNKFNISRAISIVTELSKTEGIEIKKGRDNGLTTIRMVVSSSYKPVVSSKNLYDKLSNIYKHKTRVEMLEMFPEYEAVTARGITSLICTLRGVGVVFHVITVSNRQAYKIASERNLDKLGVKLKPKVKKEEVIIKPSFVQHLFSNNAGEALKEHRLMIANMA